MRTDAFSQLLEYSNHTKKTNLVINKLSGILDEDMSKTLIMSFHPRASTTNTHITEVCIADELSKNSGLTAAWFSFTFDSGFKTGLRKDRTPTIIPFDNNFITLRSPNKIGASPISANPPIQVSEIERLREETEKLIEIGCSDLQNAMGIIKFGHVLFDIKRGGTERLFFASSERAKKITDVYKGSVDGAYNLGQSLTRMNGDLFSYNGIDLPSITFDDIIKMFPDIILEPTYISGGLFSHVCYDSSRNPVYRDGKRLKANCACSYDVPEDEFISQMGIRVVPTGLMGLLIIAMISRYTLCGSHMKIFYEENVAKANDIAKKLGYDGNLRFIIFDRNRCVQGYTISDFMAFLNMMENVSRNFYLNGSFELPVDVVDHKEWLSGYIRKRKENGGNTKDLYRDSRLTDHFLELMSRSVSRPTLYEMSVFGIPMDADLEYAECRYEDGICAGRIIPIDKSIKNGVYYSYNTSIMPIKYLPKELREAYYRL